MRRVQVPTAEVRPRLRPRALLPGVAAAEVRRRARRLRHQQRHQSAPGACSVHACMRRHSRQSLRLFILALIISYYCIYIWAKNIWGCDTIR